MEPPGQCRKRCFRELSGLRHSGERHLLAQVKQAQQQGATRTQVQNLIRKARKKRQGNKRKKLKRFEAVKRAHKDRAKRLRKQSKAAKRLKLITWNTRGWGAVYSKYDPWIKTQCLLACLERQGAGLAILSDIKFRTNGLRMYRTGLTGVGGVGSGAGRFCYERTLARMVEVQWGKILRRINSGGGKNNAQPESTLVGWGGDGGFIS